MATSNSGRTSTVNLKLLIDTKSKRVLFAEAGKDFVDFLFNFLSLPVGTIIGLLSKDGMVGCVGNLYESIEGLSATYMQPNFNKDINVQSNARKAIYVCTHKGSFINISPAYVTEDPWANCPVCGSNMSHMKTYVARRATMAAETSSSIVTYMTMDDLKVKPMSTMSSVALLHRFKVDLASLEEKVVPIGMDEGVKLHKASFELKSIVTKVFLGIEERTIN